MEQTIIEFFINLHQLYGDMLRFCSLVTLIFCVQTVLAGPIDSLWLEMPRHLTPAISRFERLNLLDYYNAGSDGETLNLFEDKTRISHKDDLLLELTYGENFTTQYCLLPEDSLLVVVKRLPAMAVYSTIHCYNIADWQERPLPYALPSAADFVISADSLIASADAYLYERFLQRASIYYEYRTADRQLVATLSLGLFAEEEQKLLWPYLRREQAVASRSVAPARNGTSDYALPNKNQ